MNESLNIPINSSKNANQTNRFFSLESSHPDLRRSFSNSPLINKHIRNSLQVPSSPIHSTSSMDSVDSFENQPTGLYNFKTYIFFVE